MEPYIEIIHNFIIFINEHFIFISVFGAVIIIFGINSLKKMEFWHEMIGAIKADVEDKAPFLLGSLIGIIVSLILRFFY